MNDIIVESAYLCLSNHINCMDKLVFNVFVENNALWLSTMFYPRISKGSSEDITLFTNILVAKYLHCYNCIYLKTSVRKNKRIY